MSPVKGRRSPLCRSSSVEFVPGSSGRGARPESSDRNRMLEYLPPAEVRNSAGPSRRPAIAFASSGNP